jgi:lipid II:glycine glycyltransferase (peptidoglycan interpeptide bridge formation enzyme)
MKADISTRTTDNNGKNDWNNHVDHPLQSWEWGEFRRSMRIKIERFFYWQISFHQIPHTPFTIGYFPKGPMPDKFMLDNLMRIGLKHHAIYIQLEPNIISNQTHDEQQITNNFFIPSHHPLFTKYTFILDLTKTESELLAQMHPKTRYNLKIAQKHNVIVNEDNSDTAFNAYLDLANTTTTRQKFFAHNEIYQRRMWENMSKAGIAKLWTATYDGKTLASWIIFLWKDTIYYPYGASSRDNREVMAPNLMLWEIAKWGKTNGYKKFDLWGAIGPNPNPSDPWYGFHRFKEGYRPKLVEFIGSFDLIIHPLLYKLYILADRLRWQLLTFTKR